MIEQIDGEGIRSWAALVEKLRAEGKGYMLDGEWLTEPVLVRAQSICRFEDGFLDQMRASGTTGAVGRVLGKKWLGGEKGHFKEVECVDERFEGEKAWNFGCGYVLRYDGPSGLVVKSVAGLMCRGRWLTEGHVEVAGDESVAAIGFGKKFFIYAKRGRAARWLVRSIRTAGTFEDRLRRGPPKGMEKSMMGAIAEEGCLIVQPGLCAHAVLTVEGPALVAG